MNFNYHSPVDRHTWWNGAWIPEGKNALISPLVVKVRTTGKYCVVKYSGDPKRGDFHRHEKLAEFDSLEVALLTCELML